MKNKNNVNEFIKFVTLIIGFIIFITGIIFEYKYSNIAALYILVILFELLFLSQKNQILTLLFITLLYFNYSIVFSNYLHIVEGTMFTKFANTSVASIGIYILLLFWLTVLLFFKTNIKEFALKNNNEQLICENKNPNSRIMVYCLYGILALIFIFGFTSPKIQGERGGVLPYYFFFYLGWIGVIAIGMYVSYLISLCNKIESKNCSGLVKCISIYTMITAPRWFLYSSTPLTRV